MYVSRNVSRFAVNLIAGGLVMFWAALAVGYCTVTPPTLPHMAPSFRLTFAVSVAAFALFGVPRIARRAFLRRPLFAQPAATPGTAWLGRLIGLVAMMHWCLFHAG
jgi:hypothetical protein